MKLLLVSIFLSLGCLDSPAADKVYNLVKVFPKSKIDRDSLATLKKRDAAEETRLVDENGKAPFRWVTGEEITKVMCSPAPGESTIYLFSSAEPLEEQEPPFSGPILHVVLCIETDKEGNILGGVSYPLEYAMHFSSGEIREIEVEGGKLQHLAKVGFKGDAKNIEYVINGLLDLTWLDQLKAR